jgi:hypothetical protein
MSVTLNLRPEIEAGLMAQAQASGMTLEEYLLSMVEGAVSPRARTPMTAQQRAAAFEAWSANHRSTPPLSDYATSRESSMKIAMIDERSYRHEHSLTERAASPRTLRSRDTRRL